MGEELRLFSNCTFAIGLLFLLELLQFLLKNLVEHSGFFSPWFALGFAFSGISRDFTTVHIGEALGLALKFGAQLIFRHVRNPSWEVLIRRN